MNSTKNAIDEIRSKLTKLRQNPLTRRKFPTDLWESIIELTETYPLNEVCRELNLQPNTISEN